MLTRRPGPRGGGVTADPDPDTDTDTDTDPDPDPDPDPDTDPAPPIIDRGPPPASSSPNVKPS